MVSEQENWPQNNLERKQVITVFEVKTRLELFSVYSLIRMDTGQFCKDRDMCVRGISWEFIIASVRIAFNTRPGSLYKVKMTSTGKLMRFDWNWKYQLDIIKGMAIGDSACREFSANSSNPISGFDRIKMTSWLAKSSHLRQ